MLPIAVDYATVYATKRAGDSLSSNIGHPGTSAQITSDTTRVSTVLSGSGGRLNPITIAAVSIIAAR